MTSDFSTTTATTATTATDPVDPRETADPDTVRGWRSWSASTEEGAGVAGSGLGPARVVVGVGERVSSPRCRSFATCLSRASFRMLPHLSCSFKF